MRLGNLQVGFIPDGENALGFSNRRYAEGVKTAEIHRLTDALEIKRLTPPPFVAAKLEAYRGRGNDDPIMSHDLEDVLFLICALVPWKT